MKLYVVTVTREDDAWTAVVQGLPGAVTYARNLTALYANVEEVIRLVEDIDDHVPIDPRYVFEGLDTDASMARELAKERGELEERRSNLNAATRSVILVLQAKGYSVRDIAGLLDITPGRVSQLTNELARTPA